MHSASTRSSSRLRSTLPRLISAWPSAAVRAGLELAVHDAAVFVEITVGGHGRIGDELAVDFECRHHLADDAEAIGLVRGKRLAQQAGDHRLLAADHIGEEVGRAADRRRAVLGAGLTEAGKILRDGEVAGHADFLAAADAHAVDAADHRLVAADDGGDHVVEQPHVAAVFLRIAGIIFGVFLGVAAGAEGLVAGAGEHHRDHVARRARRAEGEDRRLHHVGRVGVELARIVEGDPGVVEAGDRLAVGALHRTLFVMHARGDRLARRIGDEVVILWFCFGLGVLHGGAGGFGGH